MVIFEAEIVEGLFIHSEGVLIWENLVERKIGAGSCQVAEKEHFQCLSAVCMNVQKAPLHS